MNQPSPFLRALPNYFSFLRIALIIPIVALFYVHDAWGLWVMLGLYILAAITDYIDGVLARVLKAQSVFGAMIDQIADKLLVMALLLLLCANGNIAGDALPAAILIVVREIFVSGLREFMALKHIAMPVSKLAKWKTASQMVAIGLLIIYPVLAPAIILYPYALGLLWVAALLAAITAYDYWRSARPHVQ